MAKKTNKITEKEFFQPEEIEKLDPDRLYSKEDGEEIRGFYKVAVASRYQMDRIYHHYKKYVKANARPYITNCKCGTSISAYYQNLMEWFSKNSDKFVL